MVGNVSMNSTAVIPQTTEKPLKESSNFNNLLKGKMEGSESKAKLEQNPSISNDIEQKTTSNDGFVIDEVLSTISTKLEGDTSVDENPNLQEVINSLAAMLELFKNNVSTENVTKEEISNLSIQQITLEVPGISSILKENKNAVQLQGTIENLNKILNNVEEMIENPTIDVTDNKDNLGVVEGLLKDLGAKIQELTNNIKSQNTSEVIAPIKVIDTPKNREVKVLEDVIKEKATNVITKQGADDIKEESIDKIKVETTNNIPEQGADVIKEQSTDKIKVQATNVIPEQGADDIKEESTGKIKVETTNNIPELRADDIKEQSTEKIKVATTNNIPKQGTDDIKEESTDKIKVQATNIIPELRADDIKEQSTEKIKVQATNNIPKQGSDKIKVGSTNIISEQGTEDIISQVANIIQGQDTNVFKIKEVIKKLIVSKDIVNNVGQLQVNASDVKVEELKTVASDVRKEFNTLLEVIKNPLSNDIKKVVNAEKQISDFEVGKKLNPDGGTSNNNSSKKDNNSNGSILKEDKLLNSILNDKEEISVSRFTLLNNNINTVQVVNTTEVNSINKGTIVQDVIKNVKYMVTNGTKELVVKINPKELGEVLISLVQEDGALKASIKASSKDTYNLLAQNLSEIKKNLAEQNIKIQGVDISLNQEMNNYNGESFSNSSFQGREENNRFRGNYRSNSEAGTDEEIEEGYYNEEIGNLNMLV